MSERVGRALVLMGMILGSAPVLSWAQSAPAAEPDTGDDPAGGAADDVQEQLRAAEGIPEFDKVRTPHSPAFVILGVAPAEIQRATTPVDFAVSLSADMQGGQELSLPADVAIEVAPYWWFSHERLTFDDYLDAGWLSNIARNTSLSIGTSTAEVAAPGGAGEPVETTTETTLGLGLSTQLYTGVSRADICAGRVQRKAMKLAALLVAAGEDEPASARRALIVAGAERYAWEDMIEPLEARRAARRARAQARRVLADDAASEDDRARARAQASDAESALAGAESELAALAERSAERARAMQGELERAQAALERAGTPEDREQAEKRLAAARVRKRAADKAAAVTGAWRETTAARARRRAEDAREREEELSRRREAALEARKEQQLAKYRSKLQRIVELCADASAARAGWNVAVAGALAIAFAESKFSQRELDSWMTWLTISHTWSSGITVSGLGRVARYSLDGSGPDTVLDVGARVIWAKGRYAMSLEGIGRLFTEQFDGVRAAVVGEYMVQSKSWLSVSFGKDFSQDGAIFTLANLNWGFGGEASLQE